MNKNLHYTIFAIAIIALVVTAASIYRFNSMSADEYARSMNTSEEVVQGQQDIDPAPSGDRVANPDSPEPAPGKIKADVFTGKLESVDTGCFADGECFIMVDGKHVTALRGWSRDTVGTVVGVESFGDLESHIGETVEVYAQVNVDGTYTLYGSEGFYIKLTSKAGTQVSGKPTQEGACVVGGCSSQLCTDSKDGPMMSTCEYREEYACYQTATCERQATGECGWTETKELNECLLTKGSAPTFEVQ